MANMKYFEVGGKAVNLANIELVEIDGGSEDLLLEVCFTGGSRLVLGGAEARGLLSHMQLDQLLREFDARS